MQQTQDATKNGRGDAEVIVEEAVRSDQLSREEIFDVLSNERRQCVLHYLKGRENEVVPLREVVDYVAAWENDVPIADITSTERKRVYTTLRQTHLPRLDETGIVEYHSRRGEVEVSDAAHEVRLYMEYVPGDDIPWYQFYLGFSGIAAALVSLFSLGVYPFDGVDPLGMAGLLVALLVVSALVHGYYTRRNRIDRDPRYRVREA